MPQLLLRGISTEQACNMSESLLCELAEICDCGTDNFIMECIPTISIFEGKQVETYPFIHVYWFERGAEVRDRFAECVSRHVLAQGIPEVEIAFSVFETNSYYVNGKRCFD
ncbi:DUF1904 family protein [Brevibacillus laterosporus]|uniref:DUF1904 family protein n=1 Tax=Brevibacillus laterosporus LMG 15441 TaxID=1042163 RepID=A0A075R7Q8_BRELA|nr:DUF1904 family protein [Brevibacillus laterosporus]AIG27904.1 hypothetical protein BRLA_c036020 [Brevibacillus laterosporus LMG 15441]RJL07731.1 DUF1904 family protein [Brevibacillus laterosporus]TPH10796.1 DUF1904 family protein [Brevibacillus laterosporus]